MTTKLENLTKTKKKIKITVSKEDIKRHHTNAMRKMTQTVKVDGFRQGKVPESIIQQRYGDEVNYECLNAVVNESYMKALQEHDLTPILDPKFDTQPIDINKDYTFWVEVETKPKFELKEYKGLGLKKKEPNVTDKEIDEELKRLQESLAQLKAAPENASLAEGLFAAIDFDGSIDGKPFGGGQAKDYLFEFGKGQLLKDFEDQMKGMKKGEEKTIQVTFPKDYFKKELASKTASFKINVKNLHEKALPKIDDEMAKDLGKKDLNEVREELKKMVAARQERTIYQEHAQEVRKRLMKDHKIDVPETLVERELEHNKKRDKKEIEEEYKLDFILEAIAKKEDVRVNQQDVDQRLTLMAHMYRRPIDEIKKLYQDQNRVTALATQILFDKTIDLIIKNAKME